VSATLFGRCDRELLQFPPDNGTDYDGRMYGLGPCFWRSAKKGNRIYDRTQESSMLSGEFASQTVEF